MSDGLVMLVRLVRSVMSDGLVMLVRLVISDGLVRVSYVSEVSYVSYVRSMG